MCLTPIAKKEPTGYRYYPCGNCAECRKEKVNEFRGQCIGEGKIFEQFNGKTGKKIGLFLTCTYDEEHVPTMDTLYFNKTKTHRVELENGMGYYDVTFPVGEPKSIKCFDKNHIQMFFHYFTKYLKEHKIVAKHRIISSKKDKQAKFEKLPKPVELFDYEFDKETQEYKEIDIRYMYVAEYGKKWARPHYHIFLLIYNATLKPKYTNLFKAFLMRTCWQVNGVNLGNVDVSFIRDALSCSNYISKYIVKDLETTAGHNYKIADVTLYKSLHNTHILPQTYHPNYKNLFDILSNLRPDLDLYQIMDYIDYNYPSIKHTGDYKYVGVCKQKADGRTMHNFSHHSVNFGYEFYDQYITEHPEALYTGVITFVDPLNEQQEYFYRIPKAYLDARLKTLSIQNTYKYTINVPIDPMSEHPRKEKKELIEYLEGYTASLANNNKENEILGIHSSPSCPYLVDIFDTRYIRSNNEETEERYHYMQTYRNVEQTIVKHMEKLYKLAQHPTIDAELKARVMAYYELLQDDSIRWKYYQYLCDTTLTPIYLMIQPYDETLLLETLQEHAPHLLNVPFYTTFPNLNYFLVVPDTPTFREILANRVPFIESLSYTRDKYIIQLPNKKQKTYNISNSILSIFDTIISYINYYGKITADKKNKASYFAEIAKKQKARELNPHG